MKITPDPTGQHVLIWCTEMPEDLCEPGRVVAWSHGDEVSMPVVAIGFQAEPMQTITPVGSAEQARYDAVAWQQAFWNVVEVIGPDWDDVVAARKLYREAGKGRSPLVAALNVVRAYRTAVLS